MEWKGWRGSPKAQGPNSTPGADRRAGSTAEARFLLSDLCVLVHARRRRMRNECRISLDALNFFNCLSCSFPKQPLGFCRGNQCYLEARLGTSWPSLFLGVGESAPGAESCDPKAGRSRESQWPISQVSFHVIGGENGEVQTVAGICQSVQQLPLQITQCPHPEI